MMKRLVAIAMVVGLCALGLGYTPPNASAHAGHTITIDDATVSEGGNAVFQLHLSPPVEQNEFVQVTATTTSGSATSADYTPKTQTLTFEQCPGICLGAGLQLFSVQTTQDTLVEGSENLVVSLSNAVAGCTGFCITGASISDGVAIGTVTDDDSAPGASPTPSASPPAQPSPGAGGPTLAINDVVNATKVDDCGLTVSLSTPSRLPVRVTWTAGGDTDQLSGATSGELIFKPGDRSVPLTLDVIKQRKKVGLVTVQLSNAQGAPITDDEGTCSIKKKKKKKRRR